MQEGRDQAEQNRANQRGCPRVNNEARSDGRSHLEHDGVDYDKEQAEGEDRQREGYDLQHKAKGRIEIPKMTAAMSAAPKPCNSKPGTM